jgi:hypothetical protein
MMNKSGKQTPPPLGLGSVKGKSPPREVPGSVGPAGAIGSSQSQSRGKQG